MHHAIRAFLNTHHQPILFPHPLSPLTPSICFPESIVSHGTCFNISFNSDFMVVNYFCFYLSGKLFFFNFEEQLLYVKKTWLELTFCLFKNILFIYLRKRERERETKIARDSMTAWAGGRGKRKAPVEQGSLCRTQS